MRLLLLAVDFPPARGGVQTMLGELAAGLTRSARIRVVTPAAPGDRAWDARHAYAVRRSLAGPGPLARLGALQAVALDECLRHRPDVIVCGHILLGPWCRLVGAGLRVPYVALAYAYELRAPRRRSIARLALRGAAHVVAISEFTGAAVRAQGVEAARVTVIHPGVDAGGTPVPASPLPSSERIILTVGRLVDDYKGHDTVLRALPLILARVPEARYVVVGDGPLRPALERLAAALDVARAVHFTGEVSDAERDAWYARCEVFVLAARESAADGGAEGFGIACVEAGLRGKPVVAGRSGGLPDAVHAGDTGLLVDPLDPADVAGAVVRLLLEPDLAARLGAGGRRRAVEELSWSRATERLAGVLARAAAG